MEDGDVEGGLWVSLGEPLANVGITAAERTAHSDEGPGHGVADARELFRLAGRAGARDGGGGRQGACSTRELDVPPGVSSLTLPLPAGLPAVRVALSDDALAARQRR